MGIIFKNDIPYLEEQNLLELANSIATPFYVYSQKIISDTFVNLQSILKNEIYYSIKANSNQAIIALLHSKGAGVDVVSKEELQRVIRLNISRSKIIFEGVGKSKDDLEYAIKNNIRQINVESIQELELNENIANNLSIKTSIGIRINPNINSETIEKIATGRKTDKFGIDIDQLYQVCKILHESKNIKFAYRKWYTFFFRRWFLGFN